MAKDGMRVIIGSDGKSHLAFTAGGMTSVDGKMYAQAGNMSLGSDGTSYTKIGNAVLGSDGTTHLMFGDNPTFLL